MERDSGRSARGWRLLLGIVGVACLVVPLFAGSRAFGAHARGAETPAQVTVAYIAALDRHDGHAVCRLFASQLRAFETRWDAPVVGRRSCAETVTAHFRDYYSR